MHYTYGLGSALESLVEAGVAKWVADQKLKCITTAEAVIQQLRGEAMILTRMKNVVDRLAHPTGPNGAFHLTLADPAFTKYSRCEHAPRRR